MQITRTFISTLLLSGICLLIIGCSAVNSVEPFDDKQAAIIAKQWLPRPYISHHART